MALPQECPGGAPQPGAGPQLPDGSPPYPTGVDALTDGWMLLQSSQLIAPVQGDEHVNAYLDFEFVFERRFGIDTRPPERV